VGILVLVASRPTKSNQETGVAGDAVAHCTKSRKIDEKSFLKNEGKRVIEIGRLSKSPEFFGYLGSLGLQPKEIRKHTKALIDVPL
jgi:hypothetical protein